MQHQLQHGVVTTLPWLLLSAGWMRFSCIWVSNVIWMIGELSRRPLSPLTTIISYFSVAPLLSYSSRAMSWPLQRAERDFVNIHAAVAAWPMGLSTHASQLLTIPIYDAFFNCFTLANFILSPHQSPLAWMPRDERLLISPHWAHLAPAICRDFIYIMPRSSLLSAPWL